MNILKKNISIKYLYLISAFILVIMSLVIYSTYAMFTANTTSSNVVSLEAGSTYEFTINGTQNFNIGANSMASFNISVNNTASGSIYYEIYYSSSDNLTDVIIAELVEDKTITTTAPNTSGNLINEGTKIVPIVINNTTNSAKTITVGATSGFVGNAIIYGTNGYPNGTKITSTYNIGDVTTGCEGNIDTNNCIKKNNNGTINTYCLSNSQLEKEDPTHANKPILIEGMIPIVYDDNDYIWKKADINDDYDNWYDYGNKKWANAVVVTNATRDTYINASIGTPILEADILAYYVWIPRYKYQLFNPTYATGTIPQVINVEFETGTESTGTVTCSYSDLGAETCTNKTAGNYYTHPAFTYGGTELKGIWVGKFETTGSTEDPTIKPNLLGIRNQTVSALYYAVKKFETSTYLTFDGSYKADSHMMKNVEWGAVAYLKQSIYGIGNTEVYINNSSDASTYASYTGRSGGSINASTSTNGTYSYDGRTCLTTSCDTEEINSVAQGTGASTTGNITGVYDTVGGGWEYVMGNYSYYIGSSAFESINKKNCDVYSGTSTAFSHLGDATGEVSAWYGDFATFISTDYVWFRRGGRAGDGNYAGTFAFYFEGGFTSNHDGVRSVLTIKE